MKRLFDGFKNSQKIRVIMDNIMVNTNLKDAMYDTFCEPEQRAAVCDALLELSWVYRNAGSVGIAGKYRGYEIQANLIL